MHILRAYVLTGQFNIQFCLNPWSLILVYEKDVGTKMMTAYKLAELTFATDDDERRQQLLD